MYDYYYYYYYYYYYMCGRTAADCDAQRAAVGPLCRAGIVLYIQQFCY